MNKALAGLVLLLGSGALWSGAARAGGIDLALSNETANVAVILNPRRFTQGGGSELAVGGFISEDDDRLLHASLMARGYHQSATSQYSLAAGVKAIGGEIAIPEEAALIDDEDTETVGAVGLGFQAGLLLSSSPQNPVEVGFEAFYAPGITSFSDAERYAEFAARLQIDIIPQARAYVGYRRMAFDTNDYDRVQLDRSVHVGLKIVY